MKIVKCKNQHRFDLDEHKVCPKCGAEIRDELSDECGEILKDESEKVATCVELYTQIKKEPSSEVSALQTEISVDDYQKALKRIEGEKSKTFIPFNIKNNRFFPFILIALLITIVLCAIHVVRSARAEARLAEEYSTAVNLMNNGHYPEAIAIFEDLQGYSDSNDLIYGIKSSTEYISTLSIGESFYYGDYYGIPLEWTILDTQNNHVFAITTDSIYRIPYNVTWTDVTWSSCSLRTWLNDEFYSETFSSEEQSRIMTTTVSPGVNPEFLTNAGSATKDKVFLLSIDEVNRYLIENTYEVYDGDFWWLRSPGNSQYNAACVRGDGTIGYNGISVNIEGHIRPALWLNLESYENS